MEICAKCFVPSCIIIGGLSLSLNSAFLINVIHLYLFFNHSIYLNNQQQHASKPKYERQSLNENLFIDRWSSLALIFLVSCYFSKKLAQIVRRYRSTSVWKILFDCFCVFGVMTNFVVQKEFFYYAFSYSIEFNS